MSQASHNGIGPGPRTLTLKLAEACPQGPLSSTMMRQAPRTGKLIVAASTFGSSVKALLGARFFVSSVLLQQETGGNLGEILSKLSHVIRERFRLKGQVKAVSAHGRITGLVLLLMPVAVTAFIMLTNPEYLTALVADKIGRMMIYGAIFGQIIGYFVIKKIVNIKV